MFNVNFSEFILNLQVRVHRYIGANLSKNLGHFIPITEREHLANICM